MRKAGSTGESKDGEVKDDVRVQEVPRDLKTTTKINNKKPTRFTQK